MTKRQAAYFFFGATGFFLLVFVALTIHSHTRFPALTNEHLIDDQVLAGKDVWHAKNCVNCHTLLGEGAYYAPDLTKIAALRGDAYLTQFLREPSRFYSEERHGRLMPNPKLSDEEIAQTIAFLHWIAGIENLGWPPRPILVTGGLAGAAGGAERAPPASDDPVAMGEALFAAVPPGCVACHSTSPGVVLAGPSVAGVATRAAALVGSPDYAGTATTAEEYVREAIVEPSAHIAAGSDIFSVDGQSTMPNNYTETLSAEQIEHLVAYLMSLH